MTDIVACLIIGFVAGIIAGIFIEGGSRRDD